MDHCNPFLVDVLGNINSKPLNWCSSDKTNFEGTEYDTVTSKIGLHQIIKNPTHILNNSSSSIDLTFILQSNLVMESAVHASSHVNCH